MKSVTVLLNLQARISMMKILCSPFLKSESGAAAVEFAMTAPFLILLMLGIFDLGTYIHDRMRLEQISRAAVDYVMQGGPDENITNDVVAYYDPEGTEAGLYDVSSDRICTCSDGVAQSCDNVTCGSGDYSRQYVQVTINRSYTTVFDYPGIPSNMSLSGSARMRLD